MHSIRSGFATSFYVAGSPTDDIRRFGRWKSCVFHRYIHHDELMYHGISKYIARTEGFPDQLKQADSVTKAFRVVEGGEFGARRTGSGAKRPNEYERFRTGWYEIPGKNRDEGPSAYASAVARKIEGKCFDTKTTRKLGAMVDRNYEESNKENCFDADSSMSEEELSFKEDPRERERRKPRYRYQEFYHSYRSCLTAIRSRLVI